MGRTYTVPRNVKGESRILYIFSMKSFFTTAVGAGVGFLISMIFTIIGLASISLIVVIVFAGLGFAVGTVIIPDVPFIGSLRKAGGEKLGDILIRTITFSKKRKIYVYRNGGKR